MDAATWGFVGVIVGGVITAVATVGVQWLRGTQDSKLDSLKRDDDRKVESDRVQRATLLELQERLNEWMRGCAKIYMADRAALRATGQMHQLPPAVSDEAFEAGRRLMYLTERVTDDDLRTALRAVQSLSARQEAAHVVDREHTTMQSLEADWNELMRRASDVQERLGVVLRRYLTR